jgi:hypothetical protein
VSSRFRREDVSAVPGGWKVRTVKAGNHRVRVAFPPGRKVKGSGRLVSVLHPLFGKNPCANPCSLRAENPAELMVMSANNPPRRRISETREQQRAARERAAAIRAASGHNPNLTREQKDYWLAQKDYWENVEGATNKKAKRYAWEDLYKRWPELRQRNPSELLIMGANPRVEVVHGDNPPVEAITEEFTGTEVKWIDVYNEPHIPRGRYAYLAKLLSLHIKPAKGGQVQRITFGEADSAPLIVSDSTAKQIYFVGGNQDISGALEAFVSPQGGVGIVKLGEGRRIDYQGRKEHVADPDEDKWKHDHGEENGELPTVLFDTRNKRLLYEGGDYRIEGPWIRN